MTIVGRGSSAVGATNAVGVSIANSGSILGKDGATNLVGVGGANSSGVQIDNGSAGAGGLGRLTVTAQGNGIDAGLTTSGLQPILLADQGGALILEPSNGGGADALVLALTTKIQGNGNLIVRGANAAATMGIGGTASAAHSLQIDQSELATIQPGIANITFGRGEGSGLITLSDGSSNAAATIQAATANMNIVGKYATVGADLTLTTAGVATQSASNHALIVNGGAGTLRWRDDNGFNIGTVTSPAGAPKSRISVVDSVVLPGVGAVTQAAAISANGLALNGAGGDFTLNLAGNTVATVAGNASRIANTAGSLAIGTVTGAGASVTNGISVGDQVTVQTTNLVANLTLNSPVAAQGAGFAAVLATQRDVINNVGASALQTPNGNWAVYANNPNTSTFNGLVAPTNVFGNSIATLPPACLPAGANAIVLQSLKPPVPPTGGEPPPQNPPAADFSGAGSQMLELDAAVWALAAIRAIVIIGGDNYFHHDA